MRFRRHDGWYLPRSIAGQNAVIEQARDLGSIDAALKYCKARRVAVQAGARVGLWPRTLARTFEQVIAVEPEEVNYQCCVLNTAEQPNVEMIHAALGDVSGIGVLQVDPRNDGLHHLSTAAGFPVRVMRVDELQLEACDALFLDVEGTEIRAIDGAAATLERCRPVVVAEENQLCQRYGYGQGALEVHMQRYGYRLAEYFGAAQPTPENPFPGADLIFVTG